jgi:hypothetical protein
MEMLSYMQQILQPEFRMIPYAGAKEEKPKETVYYLLSGRDASISQRFFKTTKLSASIDYIDYWIQKNIFDYMYSTKGEHSKTEMVRVRIAVCMILDLKELDHDTKIAYSNWVQDLYWARKCAITDWKFKYVWEIPY